MTTEEINETVNQVEAKVNEIKTIISDMNACQGEKSKMILLAAASKLASEFKTTQMR